MAGRGVTLRFKQLLKFRECQKLVQTSGVAKAYCSAVNVYNDRDPAPLFFDDKVQNILKRLTGADLNTVLRPKLMGQKLRNPKYYFLTDKEMQKLMDKAKEKSGALLQMPPVVKERQPIEEVLSKDVSITGFMEDKILFTDITLGVSDRDRVIVVRETDGTLRQASWKERERMNQIYNPRPGRSHFKPKLFLEENLKDLLSREKYEFVLDKACAQFEPDDPDYQKVCSMTYEDIENKRKYEVLYSTRHFGPLCFYLVWNKKVDNLMIDFIHRERLAECADLVQLYQHIHKDSRSALLDIDPTDPMKLIKAYIEEDSLRRAHLQLVMQQYEDLLLERERHNQVVQESHGL